jgi:hypothetical protein
MISAKEQAAIDEITAALGADRELPLWTTDESQARLIDHRLSWESWVGRE